MSPVLNDFTESLDIVRYFNDGPVFVPLIDPNTGAAYTPNALTTYLISTLKASEEDEDDEALVQKDSRIGGITVANPSQLTLVGLDFDSLARGVTYVFDIKAVPLAGGVPVTVASGTIRFAYDITRGVDPSIPIYTTTPSALLNKVDVPATSASTGTVGQYALDGDYLYFVVAADTWRRAALMDWA